MTPKLKAPGTKLLKLKFDYLLSSFAFKFNVRRYDLAVLDTMLTKNYHDFGGRSCAGGKAVQVDPIR
jgi:hypothetical protein